MTECYACAKLAELRAENNALRVIVGDLKVPTDPGEASMMSVDAFIEKQTEHESRDSREKLEEDVREYYRIGLPGIQETKIHRLYYEQVIEWLDRQAAITERHILTHPDERDEQIAELQRDVDELTAQLEAAYAKNRSLRQHIAKMQEGRHGWHVKGAELQREVDRLTRENISLARDLGECMAERDALVAEIDALEYEGEL